MSQVLDRQTYEVGFHAPKQRLLLLRTRTSLHLGTCHAAEPTPLPLSQTQPAAHRQIPCFIAPYKHHRQPHPPSRIPHFAMHAVLRSPHPMASIPRTNPLIINSSSDNLASYPPSPGYRPAETTALRRLPTARSIRTMTLIPRTLRSPTTTRLTSSE